MNCYEEELLTYDDPLFAQVPLTFLITMTGSKRRSEYMTELNKFRLTAQVIIISNKGYKKCNKPGVDSAALDLWHANVYAAQRAAELAPGQPVFILEDDVKFTANISKFAKAIEDFFLKQTEPSAYKLGCIPYLSYRLWNTEHLRVFHAATTHAVLYNAAALARFSDFRIRWLHDLEMYQYLFVYTCSYVCATQHLDFTTENSMSWNILGVPELAYKVIANNDQDVFFTVAHTIAAYGGIYVLVIILVTILVITLRFAFFSGRVSPKLAATGRLRRWGGAQSARRC